MVREGQNDQTCPTTSELDIYEAMTRRSLAFDAVGLIQYEVFQRWVGYMFQLLRQAPPPGFNAPTITQLHVIYYMLPTPVAKEKPSEKPTKNPGNDSKKDAKEKDWNWKQWSPKQSWKKSGTGRLPEALKGCSSSSSGGKRLCFAYNINGCDKAQPGERCDKGYHLCATKNCGGKHPQ